MGGSSFVQVSTEEELISLAEAMLKAGAPKDKLTRYTLLVAKQALSAVEREIEELNNLLGE